MVQYGMSDAWAQGLVDMGIAQNNGIYDAEQRALATPAPTTPPSVSGARRYSSPPSWPEQPHRQRPAGSRSGRRGVSVIRFTTVRALRHLAARPGLAPDCRSGRGARRSAADDACWAEAT
ncbi:hypothetical protein [Streptomyces sp. NPDC005046]